jgi:diguanylate cyclase (GGDEF)-like protein
MLPDLFRTAIFQPRLEWVLGFATILSLALILTPKNLLTHTYHLEPGKLTAQIFDDRYSGGNSSAVWINETNKHWHCVLRQNYKNPYCSLRLALMDMNGAGLDLSRAATFTLKIKYLGEGSHLRVYLRNRGVNYYIPGDDLSEKYNMAEIPVKSLDQGLTIKMDEFSVADWWVSARQIPLKDTRPEFNNISDMEIQTGSASVSGEHDITLEEISWDSPLISELQLYRGITIFWTGLIVIYLLLRITTMKIALNRQQSRQKELVAINSLLTSQSRRFEDLAKTDPLTGLNNRVAMQEALYQGLNNWKRHNTPFSMVLLDIDHFKKINDTYGHDAGDEVLKSIANLLSASIRGSDFLARWGGEEFVLLYPKTHQLAAMAAAELLRQKIAAAPNPWSIPITASFGVATIASSDLDILFKSADEALYRAKNSGRNCVMGELLLNSNNTLEGGSTHDAT